MRYLAAALVALFVTSCVLGKRDAGQRGDPNAGGQTSSGSGGSSGEGGSGGGGGGAAGEGGRGSGGIEDASDSGSSGSGGTPGDDAGGGGGASGASGSGGSAAAAGSDDDGGLVTEPLQDCSYDAAQSHAGRTYYFCTSYSTWVVARDICADGGGSLVQIDDAAENDFVLGQLGFTPTWWIGANDQAAAGEWRWAEGADNDGPQLCTGDGLCAAVGGAYVNFHLGEPSALSPDESCGAVQSDGTWSDDYCITVKPFICELE